MEEKKPSPQTTLVILLGASEWPQFPGFQGSKAFANAAQKLKTYFLDPQLFGLPAENLLDLFDSEKNADELDVAISQFLERRLIDLRKAGNSARDVILYFVGHGGFIGPDADFYLAIRRTRESNPRSSGLQVTALADTLKERARFLRRIVILDCCFAAAAFSAFQGSSNGLVIEKAKAAFQEGHKAVGFPTKGTTLLCSSSNISPSRIMPDGKSTMFTNAFLIALTQRITSSDDHLTLREVKDVIANILTEMPDAPRPVMHSPDQSEGDIADIPFFPNPQTYEEVREAHDLKKGVSNKKSANFVGKNVIFVVVILIGSLLMFNAITSVLHSNQKISQTDITLSITDFMQQFGLLLYYSIGLLFVSFLHTSFHKKHYASNCKACRSHSYIWSFVIAIYSLVICFITIIYVKNYIFIVVMLALIGTIPVFPLYSINGRPITISSQTVWIFSMMIGLVTSAGIAINNVDITQFLSKLNNISVIIIAITAFIVLIATKVLNTKKKNEDIEIIFNQGAYYIVSSTLIIAFGVLLFIIMPIFFS